MQCDVDGVVNKNFTSCAKAFSVVWFFRSLIAYPATK